MNLVNTGIEDLYILEPKVFGDHRGYFFESYNEEVFHKLGIMNRFVQDNESFSTYGTLRGLHFQKGEFAQSKLVRVIKGRVLDVAVDLRTNSKSFGRTFCCELSEENKKMMLIPRGFAHGFVVLSESAIFCYKCDNFYSPSHEAGINWNDPVLKIDWKIPHEDILLSSKDMSYPMFKDIVQ
jgi:dTDP-4-dehydrorhamnose 3,5-epimerase